MIVHTSLGSYRGTISWLRDNPVQASYHFFIPKNKTNPIIQFREINTSSWHSGRYNQPNEKVKEIFKGENPNKYSIGICYEGNEGEKANSWQILAAKTLITDNGWQDLPVLAHREIAIDKPREVYDFRDGILQAISSQDYKCKKLDDYTVVELAAALVKKIRLKNV